MTFFKDVPLGLHSDDQWSVQHAFFSEWLLGETRNTLNVHAVPLHPFAHVCMPSRTVLCQKTIMLSGNLLGSLSALVIYDYVCMFTRLEVNSYMY